MEEGALSSRFLLVAILGGLAPPSFPSPDPSVQSKKCYFPHSFSDLPSKRWNLKRTVWR